MSEPGALVVSFVLGHVFYVAEIQVLLRQALTRALCASGGAWQPPRPSQTWASPARLWDPTCLTAFLRGRDRYVDPVPVLFPILPSLLASEIQTVCRMKLAENVDVAGQEPLPAESASLFR